MLNDLKNLLVLQDRDKTLKSLEKELRSIPKDVEDQQNKLKYDQQSFDSVKTLSQETQVKANTLRTERRVRQDTISKLETQMFETKKTEEYDALALEVKRYQEIVSDYETQELELMETCDELTKSAEEANTALENRKKSVAENIEALKEKARVMMERFKEAKTARVEATEGIPADILNTYDRIHKLRSDEVLSILKGSVCSGCGTKVIAGTVSSVHARVKLTNCENCSRILYEV
ncbi:hypothetical protein OAB00_00235 [Akkermansiaceae bacterium]|nr:hypothetical protein [Akkermansiaceae bacterium]